jgi:hypothetical protein
MLRTLIRVLRRICGVEGAVKAPSTSQITQFL